MIKQALTVLDSRNVIRLVIVTWIITKLICYKLWLADRLFPLIPVSDILKIFPSFIHSSLFFLSVVSMLLLLITGNRKIALVILLAEILSCLLDQNRWQPWEYQFIFMLAIYIYHRDENQIMFSWQLIIAGIFFFSGLSKLNSAFIHDVWQNLMLRRWLGLGPVNLWISRIGYSLPLIELAAGIGLLINSIRRLSIGVLFCMHGIILLMLGPTGLNINSVVWPWNILMPFLLFSIFYKGSFYAVKTNFLKPVTWFILLCWWILPWLQFAGLWDKYLSSVLYSGGVEQLFICTENDLAKNQLAPYLSKEFKVIPCTPNISVYKWGMQEMNTAPYPEKRIYDAIIVEWGKRYPSKSNKFYMYKPGFSYTIKELKYPAN